MDLLKSRDVHYRSTSFYPNWIDAVMNQIQSPIYTPTIREMPTGERPRERLLSYGANMLTSTELIAILLRGGTPGQNVLSLASSLLTQFGDLATLYRAQVHEICDIHGIGEAKACQVKAGLELGIRAAILEPPDRPVIRAAEDVKNLVAADMARLEQEKLKVLLLNNKNEVITVEDIYQGTVNSAAIRVSEILRPAVRRNCPNIIVVHNHPSGDPQPSPEDILVTRRMRQSAEMMDITLLDHIVVAERGFVSMKQKQLGF